MRCTLWSCTPWAGGCRGAGCRGHAGEQAVRLLPPPCLSRAQLDYDCTGCAGGIAGCRGPCGSARGALPLATSHHSPPALLSALRLRPRPQVSTLSSAPLLRLSSPNPRALESLVRHLLTLYCPPPPTPHPPTHPHPPPDTLRAWWRSRFPLACPPPRSLWAGSPREGPWRSCCCGQRRVNLATRSAHARLSRGGWQRRLPVGRDRGRERGSDCRGARCGGAAAAPLAFITHVPVAPPPPPPFSVCAAPVGGRGGPVLLPAAARPAAPGVRWVTIGGGGGGLPASVRGC